MQCSAPKTWQNVLTPVHTFHYTQLYGFCPGLPGWAGTRRTFTDSHLSTPILIINHPPSTAFHAILPVQFTCLTVFLHNLCPSLFWSTSCSGTLHFILHTFLLHPVIVFFLQHVDTIATCFAVVPRLLSSNPSLSTHYLGLYLLRSCHTSICPFSSLLAEVPPHFLFLQARSHFHATYFFIHDSCTISLSLTMLTCKHWYQLPEFIPSNSKFWPPQLNQHLHLHSTCHLNNKTSTNSRFALTPISAPCSMKSGPLCIFSVTFSNVDRFE